MKHRAIIPVIALAALVLVLLSAYVLGGKKPFAHLDEGEIASAELRLSPPGTTVPITGEDSLRELAALLRDVVLYRQDDAGREMDGQLVEFTLTMDNGTVESVGAYGDYLYYNEVCYRTKYEPSEALNAFGNRYASTLSETGAPPESGDRPRTAGICRTPATEAYADGWGVKLTARDITPTGLTLVCTQQDGEPGGELQTGSPYGLEVYQMGAWEPVELLAQENDVAWTAEAWSIQPSGTTEWTVDWSRLYGSLPDGTYRITKSIMDFRGTGDYEEKTYTAPFQLVTVETGEALTVSAEHDGIQLSVPYVEGWEYAIDEYADGSMNWGVRFRPAGEDGWVKLHHWDVFGVCGTGLAQSEITLANGMTAVQGTYDNHAVWDYVRISLDEGCVVAMTEGADVWLPLQEAAVMELIGGFEIEASPS